MQTNRIEISDIEIVQREFHFQSLTHPDSFFIVLFLLYPKYFLYNKCNIEVIYLFSNKCSELTDGLNENQSH